MHSQFLTKSISPKGPNLAEKLIQAGIWAGAAAVTFNIAQQTFDNALRDADKKQLEVGFRRRVPSSTSLLLSSHSRISIAKCMQSGAGKGSRPVGV